MTHELATKKAWCAWFRERLNQKEDYTGYEWELYQVLQAELQSAGLNP